MRAGTRSERRAGLETS